MKKAVAFLMVLTLLLAALPLGAAAQDTPAFYATAAAGCSTVTVDVGVRNNPGLISFTVQVGYDAAALTLLEATPLQFTSMVLSPLTNNPLIVNWCEGALTADDTSAGAFLRLTFAVKEGATCGTYPITLTYGQEDTFNTDFEDVAFVTEAGSVTVDHTYDDDADADCNGCGHVRPITYSLQTFIGNSVTEELRGLAFHFSAAVQGVTMAEDYAADYTAATVTPDSLTGAVKLVALGAVVTNGDGPLTLDAVDERYTKAVPAALLLTAGADTVTYAVRIKHIPDGKRDAAVRARAYTVYEVDGVQTVVYGEEIAASISGVVNAA